jgi:hypothetical protein
VPELPSFGDGAPLPDDEVELEHAARARSASVKDEVLAEAMKVSLMGAIGYWLKAVRKTEQPIAVKRGYE